MKQIIIYTLIALYFLSCSENRNNTTKQNTEITIKIPETKGKTYNIDDIYSSFSYIKLNTNDSTLLRSIKKVKICDTLIFIYDRSNVFIFNKEGVFINKINKGKGPGECLRPLNFTISPFNELEVLDNGNTIKVYSLTGKFKRKYNLHKWDIINFEHLNDSIILLFKGRYSKTEKHLLFAYNTNKELVIKSYFTQKDYTKGLLNGGASLYNKTFQQTPEGVLLTTSLPDNNIYLIDNDLNLRIKYHINFSSKGIPDNFFTNYTKKGRKDYKKLKTADFIHTISNFHLFHDYTKFYFTGYRGTRGNIFIGNLENNDSIMIINRTLIVDKIPIQPIGSMIGFYQNHVVSQIMPDILIEFFDKAKKDLSKSDFNELITKYPFIYRLSKEVKEEDNPIICFCEI